MKIVIILRGIFESNIRNPHPTLLAVVTGIAISVITIAIVIALDPSMPFQDVDAASKHRIKRSIEGGE